MRQALFLYQPLTRCIPSSNHAAMFLVLARSVHLLGAAAIRLFCACATVNATRADRVVAGDRMKVDICTIRVASPAESVLCRIGRAFAVLLEDRNGTFGSSISETHTSATARAYCARPAVPTA